MAESYTPRMGVRRWTADGDTFTRDELDLSFQNIEARAAIFSNGTLAARPAAGTQGKFYLLDSAEPNAAIRGQLYYDTGSAWVMVQFDLTAILATKANASHSHVLADLPVANNGEISATKLVRADDARLVSDWEPGDILWSAATSRVGFVKCDGAQYNTGDQPGLFAKIGYTFGGSGGVFNVPNVNDKFPIGASAGGKALGTSGGSATKSLAVANIPSHDHSMAHTHSINHDHGSVNTGTESADHAHYVSLGGGGHEHQYTTGTGKRDVTGNGAAGVMDWNFGNFNTAGGGGHGHEGWSGGISANHVHSVDLPNFVGTSGGSSAANTGSAGSGTAFDIMPPWVALNCFIKT
jgi:microcystin-dependent protein